jgi:branched-chain amino acid transport system ATP-binding protein
MSELTSSNLPLAGISLNGASNSNTTVDSLLKVEGITLKFKGVTALNNVSFEVQPGELFAVIGPNGAGKTSLFNVLTRVYQPMSGSIQYAGRDLLSLKTGQLASVGIARTFQNLGLFPLMTVMENLLTSRHHLMKSGVIAGGLHFGLLDSREEKLHRQKCLEIADFLGLRPWLSRLTRDLPYGIQKKIELAKVLGMEPKLLLLDEPVAGMNQEETQEIAEVILAIQREMNIAQILVELDMGIVMGIADRIMVLDFGQQIALGEPAQIQSNPDVIKAYLG